MNVSTMRRHVRCGRRVSVLAAGVGLALSVGACAGNIESPGQGDQGAPATGVVEDELVFAGPGGELGEVLREIAEKAGADEGFTVQYVEGTTAANLAALQAQSRAERVEFDLVLGNDRTVALSVAQNLVQPLNRDLLPSLSELDADWALPKDVVGDPISAVRLSVLPEGLAYNTDIFAENGWAPPTSWTDMYNPKYARCVLPVSPSSGLSYIPILNKINSGSYDDFGPTLSKFKTIAPNVTATVDASPAALESLQQGSACLAPSTQTRVLEQKAAGAPVEFVSPEEGSGFLGNPLTIPAGAPHPIAAHHALNAILAEAGAQRLLTEAYFPVTNKNVTRPADGIGAQLPLVSEFDGFGYVEVPIATYDHLDQWSRDWDSTFRR